MSTTKKAPQDRKPKADALFTFTRDKKKYTLPDAGPLALKVPGGVSMDAILEPDNEIAQLRLGLATLGVADIPKATMDVIRAMPSDEMIGLLLRWLNTGKVGTASLPESSGSSD